MGFDAELRRAEARGSMRTGWLDARFSFAFADWQPADRRRFGPLLALNEDRVQPDSGFPLHPHRDLEIVMLPRRGAVEHHDDQGGHQIVRPGQWQWMRAGRGIRHRQWNPSPAVEDQHIQIWFEPRVRGLAPSVAVQALPPAVAGRWHTLVSPDPRRGLDIGVDAELALGTAGAGAPLRTAARAGATYLHVLDGTLSVHRADAPPERLGPGDAVVFFDGVPALELQADGAAELLRFDTVAVDRVSGAARPPGGPGAA